MERPFAKSFFWLHISLDAFGSTSTFQKSRAKPVEKVDIITTCVNSCMNRKTGRFLLRGSTPFLI